MAGRIAFGELAGDTILLRDAAGESIDACLGVADTLVVSRLDCDVKCIEVPPVAAGEIEGLLRFKMRAVFPGNPELVEIDHVLQRRAGGSTAIVAIMDKEILRAYREAARGARLAVMSALLPSLLPGFSHGRIVHWTEGYAEVMRFERGAFAESLLLKRTHSAGDFSRLLRSLGDSEEGVRLLAPAKEIEWIEGHRAQGFLNGTPVQMTPMERISLPRRRVESLFREQAHTRGLSPVLVRAILALLIFALAIGLFFKRVGYAGQEVARYRAAVAGSAQDGARTVELEAEYARLEKQLAGLSAQRPIDTFRFLSDLRGVLGPNIYVSDLVLSAGGFQFQAIGRNALATMERFSAQPRFRSMTLLQTTPLPGTGREEFVVSGKYADE